MLRRRIISISFLFLAIVGISLVGCNSQPASSPSADDTKAPAADDHQDGHAGHDHTGDTTMTAMEKMKIELAKLSPEDRASAEKQHMCPVSGEMLGAMGPPLKLDVDGRKVWLCCEGCKDEFTKNPEEFLAKLKE